MRKAILTAGVAAIGALTLSACDTMRGGASSTSTSGRTSTAPAVTGANSSTTNSATTPDSPAQSAPSPQDTPR